MFLIYDDITQRIVFFCVVNFISNHLNVTPPIYVPSKSAVRKTFAAGSVASVGKSCIYVATHVKTAASPTKLKQANKMQVKKRELCCAEQMNKPMKTGHQLR